MRGALQLFCCFTLIAASHSAACGRHGESMQKTEFSRAVKNHFNRRVQAYSLVWFTDGVDFNIKTKERGRVIRIRLKNTSKLFPIKLTRDLDAAEAVDWIVNCNSGSTTKGGWRKVGGVRYDFDPIRS